MYVDQKEGFHTMTGPSIQRWDDKPWHSLNHELKYRFGEKLYKLALNGGFTCPNRDGTLGDRGCIFCSAGGSGDFAASPSLSISKQIEQAKQKVDNKFKGSRYIAYFQAYTGTYAPLPYLEDIYWQAIRHPDIAVLSIATRPDCLSDDIVDLLSRLNQFKPVWIELGLQTIHEATALYIRRGYPLSVFEQAVRKLHDAGIEIIVHTILGLPGETEQHMLDTHRYLSHQPIQGIKIQLLHILQGTDLAAVYEKKPFPVLDKEHYIDLLIRCLEILPPELVIHRLTGDGPRKLLIHPLWSLSKKQVLNEIQHQFRLRRTWQGRLFDNNPELKNKEE